MRRRIRVKCRYMGKGEDRECFWIKDHCRSCEGSRGADGFFQFTFCDILQVCVKSKCDIQRFRRSFSTSSENRTTVRISFLKDFGRLSTEVGIVMPLDPL